jgi:hypothetical protein
MYSDNIIDLCRGLQRCSCHNKPYASKLHDIKGGRMFGADVSEFVALINDHDLILLTEQGRADKP